MMQHEAHNQNNLVGITKMFKEPWKTLQKHDYLSGIKL